MRLFGLIGNNLSHSFSKKYFEEKFKNLKLSDCVYSNFELKLINEFPELIKLNKNLIGCNVTLPYKESIIPFLNELSEEAKEIGAVNCIHFKNGIIKGYNTDAFGFASSIKPFLEPHHSKALILGTGGASKAVAYSLKKIGVEVYFVTTKLKCKSNEFNYGDLNEHVMNAFKLIVNTTPLGMFPKTEEFPNIPYAFLSEKHLCYDLIYNPEQTLFLKKAKEKGASTINGYSMLQLQAEKSWEIWMNN